jgi:pimeloyl-ACP methyl ester carboxylesterase
MANEQEGSTVSVNGIDLFYEVEGSGEPLLLLHGGGGTHENWAYAGRDQFLRHTN